MATKTKNTFYSKFRKYGLLYLMMLPGLVYLFINNYLPMAGLVIAFKNIDFRKGLLGSDWIGLKNFEYLFATSDAMIITRNTLLYNAVFITVNVIMALFFAILLNEVSKKGVKKFYQSVLLLPYLISMVIISYLVNAFLNSDIGFFNKTILPMLGMHTVQWYSEPSVWPAILIIVNAWKNVGYLCVIFLSAIIGIDVEYFEAASLEGATKFQQIRYITLPMISMIVTIMVLIFIGRIFRSDFGLFYQVPMNSGALFPTTNVIDTYVYRGLMQLGDIGMSSAAGLYQAVVGFILVLTSNMVVRKYNPESSLF